MLITRLVDAMYNIIGSFSIGAASTGAVDSMRLSSLNASFAFGVHVNLSVFFIRWYKGIAFSPSRLRNRLSDARHPVNFWTSLRFLGLFIRSIALDPSFRPQESEQLAGWHAENTLLWIELHIV